MTRSESKPPVALVVPNLAGSGAEKVVLHLARMFEKRGHRVDIFLLEDLIRYDTEGLRIHPLTKRRDRFKILKGLGDRLLARRLKRRMEALVPDGRYGLVLSHLPAADRVVKSAGLAHTYFVIHTAYSMELKEFVAKRKYARAKKKERLYRRLYEGEKLIAVSEGVKRDIEEMGITYASCHVIYNPFDTEAIVKKAGEEDEALPRVPYIVSASAFRPVKRHDILLDAYVKLPDTVPPLKLLTRPSEELEAMIRQRGLEKRVEIMGFRRNPYPYIKHAELLVLSSEREGLPTVLIESLILGTPAVSTDCPTGPSEILTGSLARWLVPVNDAEALAKKIKEALQTSIEIPKEAIEKFDEANVYKRYAALF